MPVGKPVRQKSPLGRLIFLVLVYYCDLKVYFPKVRSGESPSLSGESSGGECTGGESS